MFLCESFTDFDGGSSLGLDDGDDCGPAGGQKIRIHVSDGILLENAEVAHLLVEPSPEDSKTDDSLIFQLDGHGQTLFEVICILLFREITNLDVCRVVSSNFGFNAIEVSYDGADICCVAVLGAVEKIGGAIAEYDLSGVGDEEVHEGV